MCFRQVYRVKATARAHKHPLQFYQLNVEALCTIHSLLGKVQKGTLFKFYNVMPTPILLYESECWALTTQRINTTEIAEMHFLRAAAGYRLIYEMRNEDIRKNFHVIDIITKWWGQVKMTDDQLIPTTLFKYKQARKRNQGRLMKKWKVQFLI